MDSKIILFGITFLLFFLIGCEERADSENHFSQPEQVKLLQTDYLACFNEEHNKNYPVSDTIFYDVEEETLLLNIVMNQNCAACLADSVVMRKDTAAVYIQNNCKDIANCICDYRFQYHFTGFGEHIFFQVFYKPYSGDDFNLWGELEFP